MQNLNLIPVSKRLLAIFIGLGLILPIASFPTILGHILGLSLVCFIPLVVINRVFQNIWQRLAIGWISFQVLFGAMFFYIPPSAPAHFQGGIKFWPILLLILTTPLIYLGLAILAFRFTKPNLIGSLAAASIMVLGEGLIFNKLLQFPLTFAITVFDQPVLLQLAALGGWAAVSFSLWFSNFYIGNTLTNWLNFRKNPFTKQNRQDFFIFIALGLLVLGFGIARLQYHKSAIKTGWPVQLGIVQPNTTWSNQNFPDPMKTFLDDDFTEIKSLIQSGLNLKPNILVFPEGVIGRSFGEKSTFDQLLIQSSKTSTPMLFVCRMITPSNATASAAVWVQNTKILSYRNKIKTIPFIEDKPTGNLTQNVFFNVHKGIRIGSVICFEILYSDLIGKLVNEGANILICHANTAYFGYSNWPLLHAAYTSLRATEWGTTTILVNQTGFSVGVDSVGKLFLLTALNRRAAYLTKPTSYQIKTFYSKYPYAIWIALSAMCLYGVWRRQY